MKKLRDYYVEKGLSYDKIMLKITGFKCRETSHHAIKNPARTTRKDFMEVAKVLGMPEDDAVKEWEDEKAGRIIEKGIKEASEKFDIDLRKYFKVYA